MMLHSYHILHLVSLYRVWLSDPCIRWSCIYGKCLEQSLICFDFCVFGLNKCSWPSEFTFFLNLLFSFRLNALSKDLNTFLIVILPLNSSRYCRRKRCFQNCRENKNCFNIFLKLITIQIMKSLLAQHDRLQLKRI